MNAELSNKLGFIPCTFIIHTVHSDSSCEANHCKTPKFSSMCMEQAPVFAFLL